MNSDMLLLSHTDFADYAISDAAMVIIEEDQLYFGGFKIINMTRKQQVSLSLKCMYNSHNSTLVALCYAQTAFTVYNAKCSKTSLLKYFFNVQCKY